MSVDERDVAAFGEIKADMGKKPEERVRDFLATGKNPYFRKSAEEGGFLVKLRFTNNGIRFSDALASALIGR